MGAAERREMGAVGVAPLKELGQFDKELGQLDVVDA